MLRRTGCRPIGRDRPAVRRRIAALVDAALARIILAWLALLPAAAPSRANPPGQACRAAIAAAEREHGIPDGLLQAIGVVESGQRSAETGSLMPWPWAVNVAGQGQLAPSREAALLAVTSAQARGIRSVDIGCLQINLAHHPQAFARLEDGFDPQTNARYGAGFLASLRDRTGSWTTAVAHYHSATPERGGAYQARVLAQWAGLGGVVPREASSGGAPPARDARAPLWSAAGMAVQVYRPTTSTTVQAPSIPVMRVFPMRVPVTRN